MRCAGFGETSDLAEAMRPDMSSWPNPQLRTKTERQARTLADAILAGKERLVPNAPRMRKLLMWLHVPDSHPAMRVFTAIVSETTHLPIGPERAHWEPTALARKDAEIEAAEESVREEGLMACRQVLALLPSGPSRA